MSNLRTYVTTLEMIKEQYNINTKMVRALSDEVVTYKTLVENKNKIITAQSSVIDVNENINKDLSKNLDKYRKKAKRLPYWIGAGFIGGVVLCQLSK